jgi:hypothetical protein
VLGVVVVGSGDQYSSRYITLSVSRKKNSRTPITTRGTEMRKGQHLTYAKQQQQPGKRFDISFQVRKEKRKTTGTVFF